MKAAMYHTDIVKLLIEAGADVESKDNVSERMFICTFVCVCGWRGEGVFLNHTA